MNQNQSLRGQSQTAGSSGAAITILDVRVDAVSVGQIHDYIEGVIAAGQRAQILNVNVNCLNLAWDRPWLRRMLNDAPMVFCDGTGVQWAAKLLGGPVPPRVPYNTWMWQLAEFAAQRDYAFYFLGAKPGVAERAAERLRQRNPALRIVGMRDGYFDRTPGSPENQAVVDDVNASGAQFLLLGLGMPMQEEWLLRTWPDLQVNIALTGGAATSVAPLSDRQSGVLRSGCQAEDASPLTDSSWGRYALLLVDLQHDFWSPEVRSTAPELPDRVTELLACARVRGRTAVMNGWAR